MAEINTTAGEGRSLLKEAVALGQKLGAPYKDEPIHYILIPNDSKLESLKNLQYPHGMPPDRVVANVQMRDAGSFAEYVIAYRDERTRLFAEPQFFKFLAVLDYHYPAIGGEDIRTPQFCDHKAIFQMVHDERWKIWTGQDNKPMSQVEFAEFIEDNQADLINPVPAIMLEIARDLTAKIDVNFGSSTRLQSGQVRLKYEETVKTGIPSAGDIEVPEEFSLKIPVFFGEQAVALRARLRFRINQGKLSFHYRLYRPKQVENDAFGEAVAGLESTLGAGILLGSPA